MGRHAMRRKWRVCRRELVLCGVAAIGLVALQAPQPARAQAAKPRPQTQVPDDPNALERRRFMEILKRARPAPMPRPPLQPLPALPPGGLTEFNPQTGEQRFSPSADIGEGANQTIRQPGRPGIAPINTGAARPGAASVGKEPGIASNAVQPAAATPPSPLYYTYSFPWNTVYKMLARFNVGGFDYYYVCSAASAESFHLVTAGHCVYNHDPNEDGNTSDAQWAQEVWIWAAQTDLIDPLAQPDFPYGVAKSTLLTSYVAWVNSSDFNYDWGFITLDRRMGDHTGWMGRETSVSTSALNFDGYPVELPYVPPYTLVQYPGFDYGNVLGYTSNRIQLNAYVYGGHSGGPEWRYDGVNDYIQGVNSTSDRMGYAEGTLYTNATDSDLNNIIAADRSARPPADLPNLIEYVFDTSSKALLTSSVTPGQPFSVEYNVFNAGFADSGAVTVDFYLSPDSIISTADTYAGSATLGNFPAYTYLVSTISLVAPASIAPGNYYVGWIMRESNPEQNTDDNTAVITSSTLSVTCTSDGYEPDNSNGFASLLFPGSSQTHSICPAGDQDWARFTLPGNSAVTLTTSGTAGDTRMWLYDSGLNQLDFNDDNGVNFFSTINRTCAVNPLPSGTYYVKVDDYYSTAVIGSYNLALATSPCGPTINTITPSTVTARAPTTLTVNGSNFQSGFSATVTTPSGVWPLAPPALTYVSSTQVRVQVTMNGNPPYSATLTITNPGGSSASGTFQIVAGAPAIASITPNPVTARVSTTLTVNGSNFQSGFSATVTTPSGVWPLAPAALTFVSSSQVKVQVTMNGTPPYAATLTITNPGGLSGSGTFQIVAGATAPAINSIAPNPVPSRTPTTLTVTGTNFQSGFSASVTTPSGVWFLAPAALTFVSSTQVKVQVTMNGTPPYSATLTITNPGGLSGSRGFQVAAQPAITSITPSSVPARTSTTLTVNGSNFQSGFTASVTTPSGVWPLAPAALTFVSSTQVKVQVTMNGTPPYSAALTLTNPGGLSASASFQIY